MIEKLHTQALLLLVASFLALWWSDILMKPVVHRGEDCWLACGSRQGACDFGRAGSCCKKQFASSPATCGFGRAGCVDKHCCVFSLQQDGNRSLTTCHSPSPRPPSPAPATAAASNSPRPPSVVLRNVPAAGLQGGLADSRGSPPPPPPSLRPRRGQGRRHRRQHQNRCCSTRLSCWRHPAASQPLTITLPGEVIAGITVGATAGCLLLVLCACAFGCWFFRRQNAHEYLVAHLRAELRRMKNNSHRRGRGHSRSGSNGSTTNCSRHPVRLRRPIHHLASRCERIQRHWHRRRRRHRRPSRRRSSRSSSESELPPPLPPRRLNAR